MPPRAGKPSVKVTRSCLQSLIPIGPNFYDDKHDEDLVADKSVVIAFNTALFVVQILAFGGFLMYYSMPVAFIRDATLQVDWDYGTPSYNCTPMMANSYWSSRMDYPTCKTFVMAPSDSNIASTEAGWKYKPFPLNDKYAGVPYTTFDQAVYGTADLGTAAFAALKTKLKSKNSCATDGDVEEALTSSSVWEIKKQGGGEVNDRWSATAAPSPTVTCTAYADSSSGGANDYDQWCKGDSCIRQYGVDNSYQCYDEGGRASVSVTYEPYHCTEYDPADISDLIASDSCYYDHTPPLKTKVLTYAGTDGTDPNFQWPPLIANGYVRGKDFTPCYVTAAEAKDMFTEWYSGDHVCAFAKANAPFNCEKWSAYPVLERMSLAYANSLLLYTVFSAICVKMFLSTARGAQSSGAV